MKCPKMSVNVIECHKILLYSVDIKIVVFYIPPVLRMIRRSLLLLRRIFLKGQGMIGKTIYCPRCGRKVATWDMKSKINKIARCKKCNKKVVYDIEKHETRLENLPERQTSSGVVFI